MSIMLGFLEIVYRLSLDEEELRELLDNISELKDVRCILFRNESLHLSLDLAEVNI